MKLAELVILISFILIYCEQNEKNDSFIDEEDFDDIDDNTIENLFNNIDKIVSDFIEEIDNLNDEMIQIDVKLEDDGFNDKNINFEEIIQENVLNDDEDLDEEDESIWPERPIPKYKNII